MKLQITDVPLPVRLVFDKPLSDEELFHFSAGNEVVWIERESDGTLYVKPIGGGTMSLRTGEVMAALNRWNEISDRGVLLSRTGFHLPNGSMRGAPLSWVSKERFESLSKSERAGFPRMAPDFVVEVLSVMDDALYLRRKMDEWMENGVKLGWLIDADNRTVTIFREDEEPKILLDPTTLEGSGPLCGFHLVMDTIWSE